MRELTASRTDRQTDSCWGGPPAPLADLMSQRLLGDEVICSRDVLLGWEAQASSPISSLQALLLCCNFDLPEPRPGCLQEPYPEPFLGSESVDRTAQNLSVRTKNSSIRFFEPFCHLEESSETSYLFKECSRPYLLAINRSSQEMSSPAIRCECSP